MSESDWLFICQAGLSQTSLCQIESLSTWQAVYGRWSSRKSSCDTKVTGQNESPKSESNLTHWLSSALCWWCCLYQNHLSNMRYWISRTRFWGEKRILKITEETSKNQVTFWTILGTAAAVLGATFNIVTEQVTKITEQFESLSHWVRRTSNKLRFLEQQL